MAKSWMLDELAHAGPEHLDPGFGAGFDRKQGYPDFAAGIAVLRAHGLGQESTVDFGAGTGRFALAAAACARRVVAVHISPAMLSVVRARAAEARLSSIECVQAGFLSYQHAGSAADAVFTPQRPAPGARLLESNRAGPDRRDAAAWGRPAPARLDL